MLNEQEREYRTLYFRISQNIQQNMILLLVRVNICIANIASDEPTNERN